MAELIVAAYEVIEEPQEAPVQPAVTLGPVTIGDPGRAFSDVVPVLVARGADATPDTVVDGGVLRGLELRAASVRGLSHRFEGTCRQDAFGICVDDREDWLVVAVADGVSASPLSHRAAHLVATGGCREVARRLADVARPEELDWYDIYRLLGGWIVRLAERNRASHLGAEPEVTEAPDLMATTATFVVCATGNQLPERPVTVVWWGDSPAWRLSGSGVWECLSEIKGAGQEVASSSVQALPRIPGAPVDLPVTTSVLRDGDLLLVMSDGVGDPLGTATGEVAAHLAEAWREPPGLLEFAAQVTFGRKGYDDDRTVVGIWQRGPAP